MIPDFLPEIVLLFPNLGCMFLCELFAVQVVVIAAPFEEVQVLALLHDFAVPDHQDEVCFPDGAEAVGDEEGGAVPEKMVDGGLDQLLGLGVDGGGGLVQDENSGVGQHRPGEGDQLLFPSGEPVAALAHVAVPALFQFGHHGVSGDGPGGGLNLFVCGVQAAVADVLPDRAREEMGIL